MTFTVLSPFFFVSKCATHPFQPFRRYSLHKTVASADCNILLAATSVSPLFPATSLQLRALTIFFVSPFVTHFYQRNHQTSLKFNIYLRCIVTRGSRHDESIHKTINDAVVVIIVPTDRVRSFHRSQQAPFIHLNTIEHIFRLVKTVVKFVVN